MRFGITSTAGCGVSVNNDLSEIAAVVVELITDPHQVVRALAVERYAGTDPGMGEEIVALDMACFQPGQETPVAGRQQPVELA
jgi:hypothetical protein